MHNYLYLEQENGTGVLSFLSSVCMLEELETLETKFSIYKGVQCTVWIKGPLSASYITELFVNASVFIPYLNYS